VPGSPPSRLNQDHGPQINWPLDSQHLQSCVIIDFAADLEDVVQQEPREFHAIRANGADYGTADDGFIGALQETIRKRLAQ
jgi:hypothetical protein